MVLLSASMWDASARGRRVVRRLALYSSALFVVASVISVMACGGGATSGETLAPDSQEAPATAEPATLGEKPTEEASEDPTPTPRPTVNLAPLLKTPGPTYTPTPAPTPVPHGTPLSFPMDPEASGREFISRLPEQEADCIRRTRGPDGLDSFLDSLIPRDEIRSHMFLTCLSELSSMDLILAIMSWDTGPLTDDQVACGREKFAAGEHAGDCLPWEMSVRLRVAGVTWDQPDEVKECLVSAHLDNGQRRAFPFTAPDMEEVANELTLRFALEAILCLPDDLESEAFRGIGRNAMADIFTAESLLGYPRSHPRARDFPRPSDLRCVAGTGPGRESLFAAVTPPDSGTPDAARIYGDLAQAYAECGISPFPRTATPTGIDLDTGSSVGELLSQLTGEGVSCIRERAAKERGTDAPDLAGVPAIGFLSALPEYLPECIGLEKATALSLEAIDAAVGGLSHAAYCVQGQVQEDYAGGIYPFAPPGYTRCLDADQRSSLYVATFLFGVEGVTEETRACVREVHQTGMRVSEQLRSSNPQDSVAVAVAFVNATVFLCMSDEQILQVLPAGDAPPGYFECMRKVYKSNFQDLYDALGERMFRPEGLSADEKTRLDHFLERRSGCEEILRKQSP